MTFKIIPIFISLSPQCWLLWRRKKVLHPSTTNSLSNLERACISRFHYFYSSMLQRGNWFLLPAPFLSVYSSKSICPSLFQDLWLSYLCWTHLYSNLCCIYVAICTKQQDKFLGNFQGLLQGRGGGKKSNQNCQTRIFERSRNWDGFWKNVGHVEILNLGIPKI